MAQWRTASIFFSVTTQQKTIPHKWDFSNMLYIVYFISPSLNEPVEAHQRVRMDAVGITPSPPLHPSSHDSYAWMSRAHHRVMNPLQRGDVFVLSQRAQAFSQILICRGADERTDGLHCCMRVVRSVFLASCFLSLSGPLVYWHHQLNATSAYYLFN